MQNKDYWIYCEFMLNIINYLDFLIVSLRTVQKGETLVKVLRKSLHYTQLNTGSPVNQLYYVSNFLHLYTTQCRLERQTDLRNHYACNICNHSTWFSNNFAFQWIKHISKTDLSLPISSDHINNLSTDWKHGYSIWSVNVVPDTGIVPGLCNHYVTSCDPL